MNTQFCFDYGAFISSLPAIALFVVMCAGFVFAHINEFKKVRRK